MPGVIGLPVLRALRGAEKPTLGPVMHDRRGDLVYWLVPVGRCGDGEPPHPGVVLLGVGAHLAAPDPDPVVASGWPAVWVYWPPVTGTLTALADLMDAVRAQLGPSEER
ncbi:hypothetical protein ACIGXM_31270 [Kitasatospora sp. NPDC052896]|uniref:hypothetical protein n=1 Tax=Kitasatospora sp. NPDC052896 TaxID=3364061 RepID=UPI0037C61C33